MSNIEELELRISRLEKRTSQSVVNQQSNINFQAIDKYIRNRMVQSNTLYPVGSIFISVDPTNPTITLGFGTWVAFGAGRVLVGRNAADVDFDTAEKTGGVKVEDVSHLHSIDHTHGVGTGATIGTDLNSAFAGSSEIAGSATLNIVQPYIVVYMFKRTA